MKQRNQETLTQFVQKLNNSYVPSVDEGKVTLRFSFKDETDTYQDREPTPEELTDVGFHKGYVDEHPEGSDRGGYVPYVEHVETFQYTEDGKENHYRAYHDENFGEWLPWGG